MKDGKLRSTFDARDYLDRPVKGTAASYTATVIRNADAAKLTLNPDAFAKPEGGPPAVDDFDALPDDERLLTLANGVSAMTFAGLRQPLRRIARGNASRWRRTAPPSSTSTSTPSG